MVNGFQGLLQRGLLKQLFLCSFAHQPSLFTFDDILMFKSYNLGFNLIYQVNLLLNLLRDFTHHLLPENDFMFNIIATTNFLRPFDSTQPKVPCPHYVALLAGHGIICAQSLCRATYRGYWLAGFVPYPSVLKIVGFQQEEAFAHGGFILVGFVLHSAKCKNSDKFIKIEGFLTGGKFVQYSLQTTAVFPQYKSIIV